MKFWGAVARRARLLADRNGLKTIQFPSELLNFEKNSGKRIISKREIKLLEADRRQFNDVIRISNEQIVIVGKEIKILQTHRKETGAAVKRLELQLKRQSALVGKGLARRLTIMTVDSRLADMRGEYRRTSASLMRSRTNISKIQKNILTAKSQREKKIESHDLEGTKKGRHHVGAAEVGVHNDANVTAVEHLGVVAAQAASDPGHDGLTGQGGAGRHTTMGQGGTGAGMDRGCDPHLRAQERIGVGL